MKLSFRIFVATINQANVERKVVLEQLLVNDEIPLLDNPIILNYSSTDNLYYSDFIEVSDEYANREATYIVNVYDTLPTDVDYPKIENKFLIGGKVYLKANIIKDYLYCKRLFCHLTGRYDLFVDPLKNDFADVKGIVELVFNSGQNWIETQLDIGSLMGFMYYRLPAYQSSIEFKNVRYIKKVVELVNGKYNEIPFYAQAIGMVPDQRGNELSNDIKQKLNFPEYYYTIESLPFKAISVEPTDYDRDIIIQCYYYSKKLIEDSDVNFWTIEYPDILVKSAIRELEIYMGNYDKAQIYELELLKRLNEIRKDFVAHKYGSLMPNQMVMEGPNLWLPSDTKYQLF